MAEPRSVELDLDEWDSVLMALEEEADQLSGPSYEEPSEDSIRFAGIATKIHDQISA